MKVIEGFHIKKIQRGTKKGQDYINHNVNVNIFLYKKWKIIMYNN